ncbi:MAG: response regulator transcription factor [Deltaproteobacteria bacterium]|nr:response regulator transcription factor [Deltaproteobacteria bacterium]
MNPRSVVYVIDDDVSVRKSLERLIRSAELSVQTFSSAHDFLSRTLPDYPGCLVLDVKMPGVTGLELQEKLTEAHRFIPIIFITGFGNIPASVQAMKAGAVDFLEKPFDDKTLLDAIHRAINRDIQHRQKNTELAALRRRSESLTNREREVFELVVTGMLNKQIAFQLGITEKTIKVHRARIMQKMAVQSFADLVRLAERLK